MSKVLRNLPNTLRAVAIPSEAASVQAESNALNGAVATWMDVQAWNKQPPRVGLGLTDPDYFEAYPEFELKIRCDATETLTSVSLKACELEPVTIADDTFTSSGTDDINTATAHAMLTGDGPFQLTTTDTLPAGLELATDYYVRSLSANTFSLHPTRNDAIADTNSVATTDTGTGTHTIADVQDQDNPDDNTQRFHLYLVGDLNEGNTITVGAQLGYKERIKHSPVTRWYYVEGTSGTGAQTLNIELTPVLFYEIG